MRRRDDEKMIVVGNVPEYIQIGGKLTYRPIERDDGKPEWAVLLRWDDGFERAVYNGRTGDPKTFRLMDSVGKFHQSILPEATSVTIGLPVSGKRPPSDAEDD